MNANTNFLTKQVEGLVMPTAGESPAFTEAQLPAGKLGHDSTPDRCASEQFAIAAHILTPELGPAANGGEQPAASADSSVLSAGCSPSDPARTGGIRGSGGDASSAREDARPNSLAAFIDLPLHGENTAPSYVVSTILEKFERRNSSTEYRPTSVLITLPDVETPETKRLKERNHRHELLKTFADLTRPVAQGGLGMSKSAAAKHMGEPYVNLWRYQTAFDEFGLDGLMPGTENSGRTSAFEAVLLNEAFCAKLTEVYLATVGAADGSADARAARTGRRTAKMATALTAMADEPECPALLAHKLRQGKFPICLQRFLKRITTDVEARLRGPKHFQLNGLVSRRDLTLRFPDGSRAEMPAGFKWVFDDMSANQPFWTQLDGEFLFSRQGLYALDHRSLRWLGKMLVARPREAYRSEDILRFLRDLFEAYGGKPDVIVFERGVWHARKIRGFKFTETGAAVEDEYIRPEMGEAERNNLALGLEALGVKVIFATSAHGKIIETCFNHLQDILAIKARQFVNIGRHAGEFEVGAKRLRQVRAGSHAPGNLGFATMNELAECIDAAFAHINGKVNSRKEVPDEIWVNGLDARPLEQLDLHQNWVFMPEVRETKIKGGCVSLQVDGRDVDFRAEWMVQLGNGYRVYVKLDPHNLALGAAILNREPADSPNNRRVELSTINSQPSTGLYALGDLIGYAPWEIPAPSVDVTGPIRGVVSRPLEDFYPGGVDQGDTIRRKQQRAVATHFSAMPRPGQPAVKTVEASDGLGNITRIEHGERSQQDGVPAPMADRKVVRVHNPFLAPSAEQVSKQQNRIARQAARLQQLENLKEESAT